MRKFLTSNLSVAYTIFWLWLAVVTWLFVLVYDGLLDPFRAVILGNLPGNFTVMLPVFDLRMGNVFVSIGGVLLWWRAVKVFVLHGAPLPFGIKVADGRQDGDSGGRKVACAYIGTPRGEEPKMLYFALLRAHPSSDKLVRYRLECLSLAMPYGKTLMVTESRLFWLKETSEQRARHYIQKAERYFQRTESISRNRLRREVVKGMQALDGLRNHLVREAEPTP